MKTILDPGIDVVLWLQRFSPTLDLPFMFFTFMGVEIFYLLILPLVIWSLNRQIGVRLAVIFLLSIYINATAKIIADQPRPFQYDMRVKPILPAGGGGFPSGHTQSSVVIWGYLAVMFHKRWLWALAILLMVFIPLSRVYLGVHFPTDLAGGYLIGIILLLLFLKFEPDITAWLENWPFGLQLGTAIILPVLFIILSPGENKICITIGATMLGSCIGLALERRLIGFDSSGIWWKRCLRYIVGIAILIFLYSGLKIAFTDLEPEPLFRVIRYSLTGLFIVLGAPWIFVKLRLA